MTPERAREIVNAINSYCFYKMELTDKVDSLAGISLAQMVDATRIVEEGNAARSKAPGGYTINTVPDDRLIAAVYALNHYPPDGDAVVLAPLDRRAAGLLEHTHRALGVVAITPRKDEEDEG